MVPTTQVPFGLGSIRGRTRFVLSAMIAEQRTLIVATETTPIVVTGIGAGRLAGFDSMETQKIHILHCKHPATRRPPHLTLNE